MSDEEGFLGDIAEHHDDAPRLVYADRPAGPAG